MFNGIHCNATVHDGYPLSELPYLDLSTAKETEIGRRGRHTDRGGRMERTRERWVDGWLGQREPLDRDGWAEVDGSSNPALQTLLAGR